MALFALLHKRITWWLALLLFGLTAVLYWPACSNGYVRWDDGDYSYGNPQVVQGIRSEGLKWALTTRCASNWHPLTWVSLQLDAALFGPSAAGFHRTNVLLHAANTALLFGALRFHVKVAFRSAKVSRNFRGAKGDRRGAKGERVAMWSVATGRRLAKCRGGGAFAVHPLHVESVAWVSERKDVLSALCFMLTLLAYGRYAAAPTAGRYALVLLAAALGLMAKPMLVTLPFVLLLLDFWPLGRIGWPFGCKKLSVAGCPLSAIAGDRPNFRGGDDAALEEELFRRENGTVPLRASEGLPISRVLAEKIPLLALAAAAAVLTMFAQTEAGATRTLVEMPFGERLANAVVSYAAYLGQTCWPVNLAAVYPHPAGGLSALWKSPAPRC